MKNTFKIVLALMLAGCSLQVLAASTTEEIAELKSEVAELKKGQEDMQKTLEEIKKLVQSGARGGGATFKEQVVDFKGSPVKGEEDAELTLLEFSDYQCPFCARFYEETEGQIADTYVADGTVYFVYRSFGNFIGPESQAAAEAAPHK